VVASGRLDDLSQRVSDAEREQTVETLREHLLAGRLTLDEFSERAELAYEAKTARDLVRVAEDLPAAPAGRPGSRRKPTRFTGALFGRVQRRGRLRLKRWTLAASAFADVDLDLREAVIDSPHTSVTVLASFGNVDVYVPEGVDVDVGGLTIFGHRREWGRDVARSDAPVVRIRAAGFFGTVDVWRVPHGMRGDYGEIFRQLKEQQRELPG
jgi:hypothetical protein